LPDRLTGAAGTVGHTTNLQQEIEIQRKKDHIPHHNATVLSIANFQSSERGTAKVTMNDLPLLMPLQSSANRSPAGRVPQISRLSCKINKQSIQT
jgi:hypothetical protein